MIKSTILIYKRQVCSYDAAETAQLRREYVTFVSPHPPAPSPNTGRGGVKVRFPFSQGWEKGLGDEGKRLFAFTDMLPLQTSYLSAIPLGVIVKGALSLCWFSCALPRIGLIEIVGFEQPIFKLQGIHRGG